jgi:hypothetical protein
MACASSCCSSPMEAPPKPFSSEESLRPGDNDNDSCCDEGNLTVDQAGKDDCCSNRELRHPAMATLACNDGVRSNKHEPIEDQGCKLTEALGAGSCQDTRLSRPAEPAKEGGCCDSIKVLEDDGCRPPEIVSTDRQNGCCGGSTKMAQAGAGSGTRDTKDDDDCCAPKSIDHDCQQSCLPTPEKSQLEHPDGPSCCKDKAFPCCDVSCLDRIALRECENQKTAAQGGGASNSKIKCNLQLRHQLLTFRIYRSNRISCKLKMPRRQRRKTMRPACQYGS